MRCRYKDFKVFGTHAYQEMYEALWKDDEDSSTWQYKSRGVILGKLHEIKRKAWEEHLSRCPGFD